MNTNFDLSFCAGLGLGAGLMYFLDPEVGRRRRALCRDQFVRAGHQIEEGAEKAWKDMRNRAQGVAAETSAAISGRRRQASDQVVHDRIRSAMGHHLSHPSSIDVDVHEGHVTLHGAILASEVNCLLNCVRGVFGVRGVENRLEIYDQPGNVQALQGGNRRRRIILPALSPSTRLLAGSAGAAMIGFGLTQSLPMACALGTGGLALLACSASGSQRSWPLVPEMRQGGRTSESARENTQATRRERDFEAMPIGV
jgi:hypothetical protein